MDAVVIEKLLRLAALSLAASERARLEADLDKIVAFIDAMQVVDTDGVEPLAHPLADLDDWAARQPLRSDRITEAIDREAYQEGAPEVRDGLYLVPRVVE